jgi:hypothetical protein
MIASAAHMRSHAAHRAHTHTQRALPLVTLEGRAAPAKASPSSRSTSCLQRACVRACARAGVRARVAAQMGARGVAASARAASAHACAAAAGGSAAWRGATRTPRATHPLTHQSVGHAPEALCEQGCPWRAAHVQEAHVADGVALLRHHALQVPHSQRTRSQRVARAAQAGPQLVLSCCALCVCVDGVCNVCVQCMRMEGVCSVCVCVCVSVCVEV